MNIKIIVTLYVVILSSLASSCSLADSESFSERSANVLIDPRTGYTYTSNEVFVRFKAGTPTIMMQEIAELVEGKIPEFDPPLGFYFIVFHRPFSDYSELVEVANKLQQYPEVIEAHPSPVGSDF